MQDLVGASYQEVGRTSLPSGQLLHKCACAHAVPTKEMRSASQVSFSLSKQQVFVVAHQGRVQATRKSGRWSSEVERSQVAPATSCHLIDLD